MNIISMQAGVDTIENPDNLEHLAEIFAEEMGVDFGPYSTFKEMKLCASDDTLASLENMYDNLKSEMFLAVALTGSGITPSTESQLRSVYFDLINDYLYTRLRRKISFADDAI